jgi:hypothetical protein
MRLINGLVFANSYEFDTKQKDKMHIVYHLHNADWPKLYNSRQNAEIEARRLNERLDSRVWMVKTLEVKD